MHNIKKIILRNKQIRKAKLPPVFKPQLASLTDIIPNTNDWIHEVKLDGYRLICIMDRSNVKILTRNGHDWTYKFPVLVRQLKSLPIQNGILDGEIIAMDKANHHSFQLLQQSLEENKTADLTYYIFDIVFCNNYNLTQVPLLKRKEILKSIFNAWHKPHKKIVYSKFIQGEGKKVFANAKTHGLEGIISKQINSAYVSARSQTWLKSKNVKREEFVIGGFTKPKDSRKYFGSLIVGSYNSKDELVYCGHVGAGFTEASLRKIYSLLKSNIIKMAPFKNVQTIENNKSAIWVKPQYVAEFEFLEKTKENLLRHPTFLGLRMDKPSREIKEEKIDRKKFNSEITITHPQNLFFPTKTITKIEMINYYKMISRLMLPYIANRPLSLLRAPSGKKEMFYQKHPAKFFPKEVYSVLIKEKNAQRKYIYIKEMKGLIALLQFDTLEIHVWGSHVGSLEHPDHLVFDLDPDPSLNWPKLKQATFIIANELKKINLTSFVKTTGGKGLHVVVPTQANLDWQLIQIFSKTFALYIEQKYPDLFTAKMSKKMRKHKIFLDYLRNVRGATAVAPYSMRAREGGPISIPLSWPELKKSKKMPMIYLEDYKTNLQLLKKILMKKPWKDYFKVKNDFSKIVKAGKRFHF